MPKLDLFLLDNEENFQDEVPDERVMHSGPFNSPKILQESSKNKIKHEIRSRNRMLLKTQATNNKYSKFFNCQK